MEEREVCLRLRRSAQSADHSRLQKPIKTLVRCAGFVGVLLIGAYCGHAAELPRPGEAIDAGDSHRHKDGSRVALHRVASEVAIETWG